MLDVKDLSVRYGTLDAVHSVSFTVREGEWLMIAGPNGAGQEHAAFRRRAGHTLRWNGAAGRAGCTAYEAARAGTAHRCVKPAPRSELRLYGRRNRTPLGGTLIPAHSKAAARRMPAPWRKPCALPAWPPYRKHSVLTLSGGELQRTFLAQLFAQEPDLLLLDEPTNHLDLAYQKQTFELIRQWLATPGARGRISRARFVAGAEIRHTRAAAVRRPHRRAGEKRRMRYPPRTFRRCTAWMYTAGWMIYCRTGTRGERASGGCREQAGGGRFHKHSVRQCSVRRLNRQEPEVSVHPVDAAAMPRASRRWPVSQAQRTAVFLCADQTGGNQR